MDGRKKNDDSNNVLSTWEMNGKYKVLKVPPPPQFISFCELITLLQHLTFIMMSVSTAGNRSGHFLLPSDSPKERAHLKPHWSLGDLALTLNNNKSR